jgi:phosphonatase-like hydrolase
LEEYLRRLTAAETNGKGGPRIFMGAVDLVVFDMAGTTIEDHGEVLTAFKSALRKNQISISEDFLQKWRGASKKEVLRQVIEGEFGKESPDNPKRIDQAYGDFRHLLEDLYAREGIRPIPGAVETFKWLREHNIRIALTTGFYRKVTDLILRQVGWNSGAVDASICSDEVPQGRPAPYLIFRAMEATRTTDVHRVVNVGDTTLDLLSGHYGGVRGIVGVLTGPQTIVHLGTVRHTHIIPSVAELPRLLEKEFV